MGFSAEDSSDSLLASCGQIGARTRRRWSTFHAPFQKPRTPSLPASRAAPDAQGLSRVLNCRYCSGGRCAVRAQDASFVRHVLPQRPRYRTPSHLGNDAAPAHCSLARAHRNTYDAFSPSLGGSGAAGATDDRRTRCILGGVDYGGAQRHVLRPVRCRQGAAGGQREGHITTCAADRHSDEPPPTWTHDSWRVIETSRRGACGSPPGAPHAARPIWWPHRRPPASVR